MSKRKVGFYHIIDDETGRLVVTREARVVAEEGRHYTAMMKKGEKDRLYMSVDKPIIDVTVSDESAVYILPLKALIEIDLPGFKHGNLRSSGRLPGRCGHCASPLPNYEFMIENNITECPYCNSVFREFRPSHRETLVLNWALANKEEAKGHHVSLRYQLPFGFPIPAKVPVEDLNLDKHGKTFYADKESIKEILPGFYKTLYRHEIENENKEALEAKNE